MAEFRNSSGGEGCLVARIGLSPRVVSPAVRPTHELISVVMPVRNAAVTVRQAVESVMRQTWEDWELRVVDDGSDDETPGILRDLAARDPRILPVFQGWTGITGALLTACGLATGTWIARMDADDLMDPRRLDLQIGHSRRHPDLGVVSCLIDYGGDSPGYAAHVEWLNSIVTPEEIALRRFVEAPVAHPSVLFRRDLLELHGGYRDGDFPEDYELWLRWLDAGVRFGKVPEALLQWNDPPGRLSRNDPRYNVDRFYQTKCLHLSRWIERHVPSRRKIWLWGAGRITRRRFDPLEAAGIRFEGFIDVDPAKAGVHRDGRRVVLADSLPDRSAAFILVGVGNRGASTRIASHLTACGWREGTDFLLAA